MKQAYFNDIGTFFHLGLMLTDVVIDPPTPKRELEDVPGMDGMLDVSYEATGDVKFQNRNVKLLFARADYNHDWEEIFTEIINKIHGRYMHVILDPDTDWYWDAFCTVEEPRANENKGTLRIVCDAFPYKMKREETIYNIQATAEGKQIKCKNFRMRAIPEFILTNTTQILFGDIVKSVSAGTHAFADIIFKEGDNLITFKGTGNVTVKYREGKLR